MSQEPVEDRHLDTRGEEPGKDSAAQTPPESDETTDDATTDSIVDRTFAIQLRTSADHLELYLDHTQMPDDFDSFVEDVRQELLERGTPEEWLGEEFRKRLLACKETGSLKEVLLLKGVPAKPPKDGYIQWASDYFSTGFMVDEETGAIDYRQRAAQTSVQASDLLAAIMPPEPGKNGQDVYGRTVFADKGEIPSIRVGANVREEAKEKKYYAITSGRIRFSGGLLSVDEVYTVEGNVGLETGHISHPGAVVVQGDIEPGSKVTALGDVEVQGLVDQSDVKTGGNLIVHGGINGGGKSRIVVAGRVHARFINEADMEVNKDVIVEREILQSNIKTRGAVAMQFGRLVGGETVSLMGVLVGQTGSEALVPTTLHVGEDFQLKKKVDKLYKEIDQLEDRRTQIHATVKPILQKAPKKLPDKTKQVVEKLLTESRELDKRVGQLRLQIGRLRANSKRLAKPRVEVSRIMYPETIICMAQDRMKIRDPYRGPIHAIVHKGEIEIRPGKLRWKTEEKDGA